MINLSILVVALLLLVEGWRFSVLSIQRLSPALGISLFVPTLMIPISGALMIMIVLRDLARDFRQIFAGPESLMDPLAAAVRQPDGHARPRHPDRLRR